MLVERRLQLADAAWGRFATRTAGGLLHIRDGDRRGRGLVAGRAAIRRVVRPDRGVPADRPVPSDTRTRSEPSISSFTGRFTAGSIVFLTISSIGGIMLARGSAAGRQLDFYVQAFGLAQTLSGVASTAISED